MRVATKVKCPVCEAEIDHLFIERSDLLFSTDGGWLLEKVKDSVRIQCPNCRSELGVDELDTLRIPTNLRR